MKKKTFKTEIIDLEESIKIFDKDLVRETLPQIETIDDVTRNIVQDQTGQPMPVIDSQIHHQIDPSYQ